MSSSKLLLLSAIGLLSSGCIPYIYTAQRLNPVQGRIVDSRSGEPIPNVTVAIHDHPSTKTTTCADGSFHFEGQRGTSVVLMPYEVFLINGGYWHDLYDLSHSNYCRATIDGREFLDWGFQEDRRKGLVLRPITLEPSSR